MYSQMHQCQKNSDLDRRLSKFLTQKSSQTEGVRERGLSAFQQNLMSVVTSLQVDSYRWWNTYLYVPASTLAFTNWYLICTSLILFLGFNSLPLVIHRRPESRFVLINSAIKFLIAVPTFLPILLVLVIGYYGSWRNEMLSVMHLWKARLALTLPDNGDNSFSFLYSLPKCLGKNNPGRVWYFFIFLINPKIQFEWFH